MNGRRSSVMAEHYFKVSKVLSNIHRQMYIPLRAQRTNIVKAEMIDKGTDMSVSPSASKCGSGKEKKSKTRQSSPTRLSLKVCTPQPFAKPKRKFRIVSKLRNYGKSRRTSDLPIVKRQLSEDSDSRCVFDIKDILDVTNGNIKFNNKIS